MLMGDFELDRSVKNNMKVQLLTLNSFRDEDKMRPFHEDWYDNVVLEKEERHCDINIESLCVDERDEVAGSSSQLQKRDVAQLLDERKEQQNCQIKHHIIERGVKYSDTLLNQNPMVSSTNHIFRDNNILTSMRHESDSSISTSISAFSYNKDSINKLKAHKRKMEKKLSGSLLNVSSSSILCIDKLKYRKRNMEKKLNDSLLNMSSGSIII